jgi:pyrimidine nucleoside transport protein
VFPFFYRSEKNVIEAAAKGASLAIGLVANIGANLIAFFAFLSFINSVLSYLGSLVLYPELSFEVSPLFINSFYPSTAVYIAVKHFLV